MGREIRRAFIAPAGSVLVDADYSQIELRLLAHLSGDEAMCEAFTLGQDIHARTAAEVYGVPLAEVTPQMRSSAKAVNFGIVYGISDFGLAANLHISRKEAAEFIARYFARYPAIHRFMEACVSQGKAEGYSVTMYGRRRPLPELSSPNYNRRQFGERAAMNTPVQGAAADIIKIAMNAVHDELKAAGLSASTSLSVAIVADDHLALRPLELNHRDVVSLLNLVYEGLFEIDDNYQPQPKLAYAYSFSNDMNDLITQLRKSYTADSYKNAMSLIQDQFEQDQPYICLYWRSAVLLSRETFTDVRDVRELEMLRGIENYGN